MGFLAPLYIAGLIGIALPIIFHLIRRTPAGGGVANATQRGEADLGGDEARRGPLDGGGLAYGKRGGEDAGRGGYGKAQPPTRARLRHAGGRARRGDAGARLAGGRAARGQ